MDKKYQVFISSTYKDLIEERQAVLETILDTGNIPAGMELFKGGKSQKETIERWIKESDIYLLILGGRYGSVDEKTGKSYTEWEYDLAVELNKPLFAIVLSNEYLDSSLKPSDSDMGKDKYISFKSKVTNENQGGKIVGFVDSVDQIKNQVYRNIPNIEREYADQMVGWVSANQVDELEKLKEANRKLSEQLINSQEEVIEEKNKVSAIKDDYIGDVSFEYLKQKMIKTKIPDDIVRLSLKDAESDLEDLASGNIRVFRSRDPKELEEIIELYKSDDISIYTWLMLFKEKIKTTGFGMIKNRREEIMKNEIIPFFRQYKIASLEDIIRSDPSKRPVYDKMKFTDLGFKFLTMLEMEEDQTK